MKGLLTLMTGFILGTKKGREKAFEFIEEIGKHIETEFSKKEKSDEQDNCNDIQ